FSSTCFGDDCRTYTTASRSRCDGWTFAELARPTGGIAGESVDFATRVFSAVFMPHLLVAGRWLKLLGDDVAENLERAPALFVRERRPQVRQAQPLNRWRFRRGTGASWDLGMVILLDSRSD